MAIAHDTSVDGGSASGTSLTYPITATGTDRVLWVGVMTLADVVTGVTYNGVAMTQVGKTAESGGGTWEHLYVLPGPASGSHNVVVSTSGSTTIWSLASSYTNGAQSGQPDSGNTGTAAASTSLTLSTTVVGTNCWLVGFWRDSLAAPGAGTGTTLRQTTGNGIAMGDSNGAVGTGSRSLQATVGGATTWGGVIGSMAEFSVTAAPGVHLIRKRADDGVTFFGV